MTPADLAFKMERVLPKMTAGPWRWVRDVFSVRISTGRAPGFPIKVPYDPNSKRSDAIGSLAQAEAEAEFICLCRDNAAMIVAALKRSQQ